MTTKTEELNAIASRANKPAKNAAFRRDRDGKLAKGRRRLELSKELAGGPMGVDELEAAIDLCRSRFGIVLDCRLSGGVTVRPRLSQRELLSLAASVNEGTCHRDRVQAVQRLTRCGFAVSFVGDAPAGDARRGEGLPIRFAK